jgi:hypothetical protein
MYIISRLALVPTQSRIEWVVGVKQLGCETDHSPTYIVDIKKKKSCTSSLYRVIQEESALLWEMIV